MAADSTASSNLTLTAEWTAVPIVVLSISCTSGLLNSLASALVATHRRLYTPFNVYLMNLMAANILYAVLEMPMEVVDDLYSSWWLGERCCTLYMYSNWVISLAQVYMHVLIALNRFWALVYPVSYMRHRVRAAWMLCFGAWAWAHVIAVPMVAFNEVHFATSFATNGCHIYTENSKVQVIWLDVNQVVVSAGVLIVLAVFPFVLYKRSRRLKGVRSGAEPSTKLSSLINRARGADPPANQETYETGASSTSTAVVARNGQQMSANKVLLLALLTASITVCWIPILAANTLAPLVEIPPGVISGLFCLYDLQAVVDPVIFVLAVQDIRQAFFACFC